MNESTYDTIGQGYREFRQPDPRIAGHIDRAIGSARTVLNVGAGAGSYEPGGREVVAVEPSAVMIAQRPAGSAPVVQARAEDLPFEDRSFDVVMGVLTIQHWQDLAAGLREAIRVARERVVLVTVDNEAMADLWLVDEYFPEAMEYHAARMPSIDRLRNLLEAPSVAPIPIPARCSDRFFIALWDQPEACLDPAVRRVSSVWHQMPRAAVERGLDALAEDLRSGRWHERYGHLRDRIELDVGLRLVTADVLT